MGIWYKDWYLATDAGEAELLAALRDPVDGDQNTADIQQRLSELQEIPEGRCLISQDQKKFLQKVLREK